MSNLKRDGIELEAFLNAFNSNVPRGHVHDYCRVLLSDLPRKTAVAIAHGVGAVPRTIQHFLNASKWDHDGLLAEVQRFIAENCKASDPDPDGLIAVLDETSIPKRGSKTPGVAKQFLESLGKVRPGIILADLAIVQNGIGNHFGSELFLPESWDLDRDRCRAANIPDAIIHRPPWELCRMLLDGAAEHDVHPDWVVFTRSIGRHPQLIEMLLTKGRRFVGSVPWTFPCRTRQVRQNGYKVHYVNNDQSLLPLNGSDINGDFSHAKSIEIQLGEHSETWLRLIKLRDSVDGQPLYLLTNVQLDSVPLALETWRSASSAHDLLKSLPCEQAIRHFEGRSYIAFRRHLALCLLASAFSVVVKTPKPRRTAER